MNLDALIREKEEQIQRDLAEGLSPTGKKQTVYELCERYVKTKSRNQRDNTVAAYRTSLNIINDEPFGHRKIGDITTSEAKAFLIHLQDDEGRSYSAIQNIRGVLRPAFDTAVEDDYVRKNPFDFMLKTVVKNDTKQRDALTAEEMAGFLAFVHESKSYAKYYNAFYLQFFTGLLRALSADPRER